MASVGHLRARPQRRLRYELYSLTAVLSVFVGLACIFPYSQLSFRASTRPLAQAASCAIVTLTPEQEALAMKATRTAWAVGTESVQRLRTDLSVAAFPQETINLVLPTCPPAYAREWPRVPFAVSPLPPSGAAAKPVRLARLDDSGAGTDVFSREELLNFDSIERRIKP